MRFEEQEEGVVRQDTEVSSSAPVRSSARPPCLDARAADRASCAVFILLLVIISLTFRDYGINSDEIMHVTNGPVILEYYYTLFSEGLSPAARAFYENGRYVYNMYRYGGIVDAPITLLARVMPLALIETWHLILACIGLLGIVGCWKLTRLLAGGRAALGAVLMLALVPAYYGHMFNNPKDVPFAAFYVWSVYYIVRVVLCESRAPWTVTLRLGLAMGASMGVRFGGLLLPMYLTMFMCVRHLAPAGGGHDARRSWPESLGTFATTVLPATLIAYAVMLAGWPWIHSAPVTRPFAALAEVTSQPMPFISVLYGGQLFTPNTLPVTYTLWHLVIQLPLLIVVLSGIGVAIGAVLRTRNGLWSSGGLGAVGIVIVTAVFPLVYAAIRHAPVYNGFRHFLFVVPPLVCLAAITLAWFDEWCATRNPLIRRTAGIVFVGCLAWIAVAMIHLHPYQYIYYNALVGGIRGAQGRYELDYYCHTYAGAVRLLDRRLRDLHGARYATMRFSVYTADHPFSSTPFFPGNWNRPVDASRAEFVIDKVPRPGAVVLDTIQRNGVTLNYVMTGVPAARETSRGLRGG